MKKRLFALFPIVIIALVLLGGIPVWASHSLGDDASNEVRLTEVDHGGQVALYGSQVLVLNLESNPSTGYGWEVQGLNQSVLRQYGESEWIPGSNLLGASGTYVMRFAGVAEGKTEVNLVYRRSWEKDVEAAQSFSVQVQVVNPASNNPAPAPAKQKPAASFDGGATMSLPSSYSWCDNGGCTPVRDQGACGSCWAFGTVGPMESSILINDGVSRDLSEQYLVSCNVDGWGCNGGWWAHDYHEWKIPPGENAAGAVYESAFRYKAEDLPCNGPYNHQETLDSWSYVGNDSSVPSVDALKQAIYDYGPVGAAVCADNNFQAYSGGVFNPRKPCNSVNHAIVLVGWDDADGAWILRNSWGTGWGESGYMRIAYGKSKVGYSANYVVYGGGNPTPTPTPTPEPTPTPPPEGTMHISAIDMWYTTQGPNYKVYTKVTIVDEYDNPVSGATVDLSMTLPSGSASGSSTTGADGTVTFYIRSKLTGTYTSEVTDVTHISYTYDPSANVETSETLNVP